jgi:hypothetical protein
MIDIKIAIFSSEGIALDNINLAFLNLKFIKIGELQKYIRQFDEYEQTEESLKHHKQDFDIDSLYALVPDNFRIQNAVNIYEDIYCAFLILYPSSITICSITNYELLSDSYGHFSGETTWGGIKNGLHRKLVSDFKLDDRSLVEEFIKFFCSSKKRFPKYLELCISNYINHYFIWHDNLSFISLCMSMETIVEGKEQVSYKIRRNMAVLNGSSVEECRQLEKNVRKIYELRSGLVHGETAKSYDELKVYFDYLRDLIALTILEIITMGFPDRLILNQKINESGYGEKSKLWQIYNQQYDTRFNRVRNTILS